MLDIAKYFCVNKQCGDYGRRGKGNLNVHFAYGAGLIRHMLYCTTCEARFSETRRAAFFGSKYKGETIGRIVRTAGEGLGVRATARSLGLDKNAVNRIFLKAGEHCENVLDNLLSDLGLSEVQLDELWSFIQKKLDRGGWRRRRGVGVGCHRHEDAAFNPCDGWGTHIGELQILS